VAIRRRVTTLSVDPTATTRVRLCRPVHDTAPVISSSNTPAGTSAGRRLGPHSKLYKDCGLNGISVSHSTMVS